MNEIPHPEVMNLAPKPIKEIVGSILESKFSPEDRNEAGSRINLLRCQLMLAIDDAIPDDMRKNGGAAAIIEGVETSIWNDAQQEILEKAENGNIKDVLRKAINLEIDGKKMGILSYINNKVQTYAGSPAGQTEPIPAPTAQIPPAPEQAAPEEETVVVAPPPPEILPPEPIIEPVQITVPAPEPAPEPTAEPKPEPTAEPEPVEEPAPAFTPTPYETSRPAPEYPAIPGGHEPYPPYIPTLGDQEFLSRIQTSQNIPAEPEQDEAVAPAPEPAPKSTAEPDEERVDEPLPPEPTKEEIGRISADDIPEVTEEIIAEISLPEQPEDKERLAWAKDLFERISDFWERKGGTIRKTALVGALLISLVTSMQLIPKPFTPDNLPQEPVKIENRISHASQIANFIDGETDIPADVRDRIKSDLEYIGSQNKELEVDKKDVLEDKDFVYPDSELCLRDILFIIDRLGKKSLDKTVMVEENDYLDKYARTAELLLNAKMQHPQAVKFKLKTQFGRYHIEPVDWQESVRVKESESADFLVVGGELESVAAAIHAADKGESVILLYSGPLGGLNAKEGGNMRFFDYVSSAPISDSQRKIMGVLGMTGDRSYSVPPDASDRLQRMLTSEYAGRIKVVQTDSYNSIHLNFNQQREIGSVTTNEGVQIKAKYVIDAEPTAILAEKAGLDIDIDTPNISYGVVFDVDGIDAETLKLLSSRDAISPETLKALADISEEEIAKNPTLAEKYQKYQSSLTAKTTTINHNASWGYLKLALAFDFYMNCLEYKEQNPVQKQKLSDLNSSRNLNGFNVSILGNEATFNSISYVGYKKAIYQNDHSLTKDKQFSDIREIDLPCFEEFLIEITHKNLSVRCPDQFYVRQSSACYYTENQYKDSDFSNEQIPAAKKGLPMTYRIDLRTAKPRDKYENDCLNKIYHFQDTFDGKPANWLIRPETSLTKVKNLGIVSPAIAPPKYVGALRIQQNLIGTSQSLVDLYMLKDSQGKSQLVASAAKNLESKTATKNE